MRDQCVQIWIGRADDQAALDDLLSEDAFWTLDEAQQDHAPLTAFGRSQGLLWYDHDRLESGWVDATDPLGSPFSAYSYAEHWTPALSAFSEVHDLDNANCLIVYCSDDGAVQISDPRDVTAPGILMRYVGAVTFPLK